MVSLDKAIIAKYDHEGEHFEVYVDPDAAYDYRTGQKKDLNNILVVEEIFEDAKKAEKQTQQKIQKAFGSTDIIEVLKIILKKGEVPLTTEQRKKLLEEKRKKVVAILARECADPRTGAPHPPQRIEKAMDEAKVHIDPFKSPEEQVEEVLKALRLILPLKFEKVRIAVRVPAEHAQRCYGTLKQFHINKEEWQSNGSLIVVLEMPAGMQGDFFGKINKVTGGNVETKVLKQK